MVKLRLRRMGRHKRPLYAVVAADARSPRDGRYIEDLGRYEPLNEPALIKLKKDRILYWLEEGAQPTDTVRSIFSKEGIMLALHMRRKGAEADAIEAAVEAHCAAVVEKRAAGTKTTAKDRKQAMLAAEGKVAAKQDAELAKQRAEAEAKATKDAEAAQKAAAEERALAAQEAKKEQEAANVEAKKAQEAANAETAKAEGDAPTADAPAAVAAPDADAAAKAEAAPGADKAADAEAVPEPAAETKED